KPQVPEPPPPPLTPRPGAEFKRDLKRLKKRGKDMEKLRAVIETLCAHGRLDPKHKDHPLSGEWNGWRYCHVEADWIRIDREEAGEAEGAPPGRRRGGPGWPAPVPPPPEGGVLPPFRRPRAVGRRRGPRIGKSVSFQHFPPPRGGPAIPPIEPAGWTRRGL